MKTKSILYIFVAMTVLLAFAVAPVAAAPGGGAQVVRLVEKTAVDTGAYPIIPNGAFGMFQYKAEGFKFVGQKLAPVEYTLINYVEPWGTPVGILGKGTPDIRGKLVIEGGAVALIYSDYTLGTPTSDEYAGQGLGAKIWLVPTSDLTGNLFNAWNPTTYLFETTLIPKPV